MTTTPEPLENKVDRLETALGRLAELSFNNAARHDRSIDRMETAITNLTNTVTNLTNTVASNHAKTEQAITQLVEVTTRNSENINRMENAITNLTNTVANNNGRIEQILEYLRNRNGGSSPL